MVDRRAGSAGAGLPGDGDLFPFIRATTEVSEQTSVARDPLALDRCASTPQTDASEGGTDSDGSIIEDVISVLVYN